MQQAALRDLDESLAEVDRPKAELRGTAQYVFRSRTRDDAIRRAALLLDAEPSDPDVRRLARRQLRETAQIELARRPWLVRRSPIEGSSTSSARWRRAAASSSPASTSARCWPWSSGSRCCRAAACTSRAGTGRACRSRPAEPAAGSWR